MDPSQQMAALLELQKLNSSKSDLVQKIAERFALNRKSEMSADLSMHERDSHQKYWEHQYYSHHMCKNEDNLRALREEYKGICEQIELLVAMLSEHIPEFIYPTPA